MTEHSRSKIKVEYNEKEGIYINIIENDGVFSNDLFSREDDLLVGIPTGVIATNIPTCVFEFNSDKSLFEEIFKSYAHQSQPRFTYFRGFRRVRVDFRTPSEAASARVALHQYRWKDNTIKVYFVQPQDTPTHASLEPPEGDRLFLISPPSSPPVGWKPIREMSPSINFELLAALAKLAPGEVHELVAAEGKFPSITIETVHDTSGKSKSPIMQTQCPPR